MVTWVQRIGASVALAACASGPALADERVSSRLYGVMPDGREVMAFTVRNASGMTLEVIEYGAILTRLTAPDRDGVMADVVLGLDSLEAYRARNPFFGATMGRVTNRINADAVVIAGERFPLETGGGPTQSHGGPVGFGKRVWTGEAFVRDGAAGVRLTMISPDGDQGFPGTLTTEVVYTLDDDNRLTVSYRAETDAPTLVNLTNHSYFNLAGHASGVTDAQTVRIDAELYLVTADRNMPTGALAPVEGLPIDFRTEKPLGQDLDLAHPVMAGPRGWGHYYVLNRSAGEPEALHTAAVMADPVSGREMTVSTTELSLVTYNAQGWAEPFAGKDGASYPARAGFCFETQGFVSAPTIAHFPSVRLDPGAVYRQTTVFAFRVRA